MGPLLMFLVFGPLVICMWALVGLLLYWIITDTFGD